MLTLFGEIETLTPPERKESRLAERRRKAQLAYQFTADAWKRWTYKLAVEEFLPARESFMFEEFSTFYETEAAKRRLPATVNGKAFAGLQRNLVNEGLIVKLEGVSRCRSNGQMGLVYRSRIYKP